jgi:hypothetical protein
MGQSTEDLFEELKALTVKLKWLNDSGQERSRNMSLCITNLENAEDKLRRHIEAVNSVA